MMKQCSIELDNQNRAATVRDVIIANMINRLIVYYMYQCALLESDNKFYLDFFPFCSVTI